MKARHAARAATGLMLGVGTQAAEPVTPMHGCQRHTIHGDWWECHECEALWTDGQIGPDWRPRACLDRRDGGWKRTRDQSG
jgi:hypothetical protein